MQIAANIICKLKINSLYLGGKKKKKTFYKQKLLLLLLF